MNKERERIIELFLGLIFVVLLIMAVIFVLYFPYFNASGQTGVQTTSYQFPTQVQQNVVTNYITYNNISYNQASDQITIVTIKNRDYGNYRNYDYDFSNHKNQSYNEGYLKYSSRGEHLKEKIIFNNYRDEFDVYVVNKDYQNGYFKVKFNFCDHYDNCFSETVEKYIQAGKEAKFVYLDVQSERYKYSTWTYEVLPEKISS